MLGAVGEVEALPETGVVAEFVPVAADGHDGAGDGLGGQVGEDLDEHLLGKAVDVDPALLLVEDVVVGTVVAVPVAIALVLAVLVRLVATEKGLEACERQESKQKIYRFRS